MLLRLKLVTRAWLNPPSVTAQGELDMKSRFAIYAGLAIFCSGLLLNRPAQSAPVECEPSIGVEPMTSGLARLSLSAPCFSGHKVRFLYGGLELTRKLDGVGRLAVVFDCFL